MIIYLIPPPGQAQFVKGQKLIGGNLLFSTNSGNSTPTIFDNRNVYYSSNTAIGINPSIAKFVSAKSLHGLGIVYNYSHYHIKEENPDNGNSYNDVSHSGGINIFSQHFLPLGNNFFFTAQTSATALYNYNKSADVVSKATSKVKGYSVYGALAPGVSYKINKRFLFDAFLSNLLFLGYRRSNTTTNYPLPKETKTYNDSFYISTSLSNTALGNIGLGFRWLLKNK